jgi:hypothetical protein
MAKDIAKKRAELSISDLYKKTGPVEGPSLSSIWAEHLASLPQKTEDNLRHQQDVMNRAFPYAMNNGKLEFKQADPEAISELTDMVSGVGGVVKNVGGNWLRPIKEELEQFAPTAKRSLNPSDAEELQRLKSIGYTDRQIEKRINNHFLRNWVNSNLGNYVKNQMGTPEDPVRALAEQGILHMPLAQELSLLNKTVIENKRQSAGFPKEGLAKSDLAKQWENITDRAISTTNPKTFLKGSKFDSINEEAAKNYPWMTKLPDDTDIHHVNYLYSDDLGFNHIIDVLREHLNSGELRANQLNKVSVPDAVMRAHLYDQEMAKKMASAKAAAMENMTLHKEYPTGYKWVQLDRPGQFASESDVMGHSVRGYEPEFGHPDFIEESGNFGSNYYGLGGWPAIKRGDAKVFSLRDPQGNSHVTIEGRSVLPRYESLPKELRGDQVAADEWFKNNKPLEITQIKGKQNAKPHNDYLPYVQDFVQSGNHNVVGDLKNSGLIPAEAAYFPHEVESLNNLGHHVPKYITNEDAIRLDKALGREPQPPIPMPEDDYLR